MTIAIPGLNQYSKILKLYWEKKKLEKKSMLKLQAIFSGAGHGDLDFGLPFLGQTSDRGLPVMREEQKPSFEMDIYEGHSSQELPCVTFHEGSPTAWTDVVGKDLQAELLGCYKWCVSFLEYNINLNLSLFHLSYYWM